MICFQNMLLLCTYELCNYISYQVENCENNIIFTANCESNIIFTGNCENNSKSCGSNIIFTEHCEVIRQKLKMTRFT